MALFVEVHKSKLQTKDIFVVTGEWEDGGSFETFVVSRIPGMTAAETVEYTMLEQGFVASWTWGLNRGIDLTGQFVMGIPYYSEGQRIKSMKEVAYSNAHAFDL
jgi:hypothetical protein